jgi:hypothetical protein
VSACRFAAHAVGRGADASTWVNAKGCNLGRNQAAVDALRVLFGGQATVTAPKRTVRIENLSYGAKFPGRRTPAEVITWMVRNTYLPPTAESWDADRKKSFVEPSCSREGGRCPALGGRLPGEHRRLPAGGSVASVGWGPRGGRAPGSSGEADAACWPIGQSSVGQLAPGVLPGTCWSPESRTPRVGQLADRVPAN